MDNHYYLRLKIITGKIILSWSISYYISICMLHRHNIHWTRIQSYSEISVYRDPEQYGRKYLRKPKVHFSVLPSSFSPFCFARFYISPSHSARPLNRIQRDRYCFLFPRGMSGQFQIGEQRSRSLQKQMYVGHFRGWFGGGCRRGRG